MSIASKFTKRNEDFTVTICDNGYYLTVGGRNVDDDWIDHKFIYPTFTELCDAILAYESLPRS